MARTTATESLLRQQKRGVSLASADFAVASPWVNPGKRELEMESKEQPSVFRRLFLSSRRREPISKTLCSFLEVWLAENSAETVNFVFIFFCFSVVERMTVIASHALATA